MGITGTQATVRLAEDAPRPHRRLSHIVEIIQDAGYAQAVETRATTIFRALAEAEAGIHGIGVDEVHFHEVGATDAIVDIVAAALGLEWLGIERAWSRTVEVGGGMVRCAHGLMPVPAPATAALLAGAPCSYGRVEAETTTPTGAAILRGSVDVFGEPARFTSARVGYGIGQKDFAIPNVLRVLLGTAEAGEESRRPLRDRDQRRDRLQRRRHEPRGVPAADRGALRGRRPGRDGDARPDEEVPAGAPGVRVLAHPDDLPAVVDRLVRDSTTIGVRFRDVQQVDAATRDRHGIRRPLGTCG